MGSTPTLPRSHSFSLLFRGLAGHTWPLGPGQAVRLGLTIGCVFGNLSPRCPRVAVCPGARFPGLRSVVEMRGHHPRPPRCHHDPLSQNAEPAAEVGSEVTFSPGQGLFKVAVFSLSFPSLPPQRFLFFLPLSPPPRHLSVPGPACLRTGTSVER